MSDIVNFQPIRALDRDGIPVAGALAYFYLSGTTTPQVVYTSAALDVAHPSPLVADSRGVFPPVFSALALRCTVTDASGVTLPGFPIDPVATISTGSGADQVSFAPTGDIPETNVQAAIERVQLNAVAPLLAGGIGVTGNADTLADIDATNIASGAYRYTTGAAGTFPAGVTAADGGTIRLWRETAAEAVMELVARGSNVTWVRTLTGSAWGAWAFGIATQAQAEAGAVATALMTPLATRQAFNAAGTAPVYAARAWCSFVGATGSVTSAGNVASVTRTGVGLYTINFTTALPTSNYIPFVITNAGNIFIAIGSRSTSSCSVQARNNTGALTDPSDLYFAAIGG
jgi:hypothetical protein